MTSEITFKDKDLLVMKLLHYFITDKKYNPIILRGLNNEIWLENLDEDYQIVRINTGYVHNDEQLDYDLFKTKRIVNKIKLKTFSLSLNTLSLFVDLGDNVDLSKIDVPCVKISNESDIVSSNLIIDAYPDIKDKLTFDEKGIDLFSRITGDINKKNAIDQKEAEEVFSPKEPIVTYIIMGICIIVFFVSIFLSNNNLTPSFLASFGALNKLLVVYNNEFYRLLTCTFLHGSLLHLVFNMYALFAVGRSVESYYGKYKYIFIYVVSGLVASLFSLIFLSETSVSVGASGAIFGLMGALLYFGINYRTILNDAIVKQILPVIVINLMIGFTSSGIDNFAHIGGLIGGFMAAMAMGVKYRTTKKQETNGVIVLTLLVCFLLFMIYR